MQLGDLGIHQRVGVSRLDVCNLSLDKFLNDFRAATDEGLGVGERFQVW